MVELVHRMQLHDRVLVGSFTERVLRRFRARLAARSPADAGRLPTSCGVATTTVARFAPGGHRLQRLLRDAGAVYQVPHHHRGLLVVDEGFVRRAHAGGRHVHVWTVDDRAEMEHLLDLGVDGLITDRPDVLREVLLARGLWEGTT
jgi:glycerophosphoryl diester phosphodiesterase